MKRVTVLFLMIFILALNSDLYGQTSALSKKEQRKITMQEREMTKAEEAASQFDLMEAMVSSRKYVIEADRVSYGRFEYSVQSELNFIMIDSISSAVQTGIRSKSGGNGIGGWTTNGEVRNYSVKFNERRNSFIIKYKAHLILVLCIKSSHNYFYPE